MRALAVVLVCSSVYADNSIPTGPWFERCGSRLRLLGATVTHGSQSRSHIVYATVGKFLVVVSQVDDDPLLPETGWRPGVARVMMRHRGRRGAHVQGYDLPDAEWQPLFDRFRPAVDACLRD
jgi:hypothetical protein